MWLAVCSMLLDPAFDQLMHCRVSSTVRFYLLPAVFNFSTCVITLLCLCPLDHIFSVLCQELLERVLQESGYGGVAGLQQYWLREVWGTAAQRHSDLQQLKTEYVELKQNVKVCIFLLILFNNPHVRQPGWRWIWAGRASLEDRPSYWLVVSVGLCVAKWLGACPVAGSALAAAASGACPGHRALAQGRIGRLPRPHRGAPSVSIYAALIGRTPNRFGHCVYVFYEVYPWSYNI